MDIGLISSRKIGTLLTVAFAIVPAFLIFVYSTFGLLFGVVGVFAEGFSVQGILWILFMLGAIGGFIGLLRAANWCSDTVTALLLASGLCAMTYGVYAFQFDSDFSNFKFVALVLDEKGALDWGGIWTTLGPMMAGTFHLIRIGIAGRGGKKNT